MVQNQNEEETEEEEEREDIDTGNESNKSPWAQQVDEEDKWDTATENKNIMQKEQQNVNWENKLDDSYIPPRQKQTTHEQTSTKSTYSLMASMEVDEEERKQKERQLEREREEERKKKPKWKNEKQHSRNRCIIKKTNGNNLKHYQEDKWEQSQKGGKKYNYHHKNKIK